MKRLNTLILISLIFSISANCQVYNQAKNMDLKVVRDFAESINSSSDKNNHWRVPASWKVIVVGDKIKLWQVYADNSVVIDIVNKYK